MMNGIRKAIVIGCPGSGKSTFSRKLRDLTGLPLYYLDRWIIDGNYSRTLELRLQKCDTVFLFDLPLEDCLQGAASRIGTVREDLPWVETEFDPEFRQWIEDFPRDQLPRIYELLRQSGTGRTVFIFRSRQEADSWLRDHVNEQPDDAV